MQTVTDDGIWVLTLHGNTVPLNSNLGLLSGTDKQKSSIFDLADQCHHLIHPNGYSYWTFSLAQSTVLLGEANLLKARQPGFAWKFFCHESTANRAWSLHSDNVVSYKPQNSLG